MANRSLWCIPSSLHFFFFHSVARIGLHRDGTGLRWSASGPSHKQRLTAVALLIFTLNQVLWYARALKHPCPRHAMQLTAPIRLVRVADLGCPLDARGDKKIFVPKMTHDFQHVFVGAEVCSEIVVGARSRELDALDEIMKIVLTTCPRVSADVDVDTVRAKSFHAVAYGRYRFRLVKWLLIRAIIWEDWRSEKECEEALESTAPRQSNQLPENTQTDCAPALDPTA
ncbi:hypothetical protein C8R45DRAFT_942579 [Mycena sanguinolenta]|nr:hypothetical protein C8R45DRAFT_942579 [Mycena sanguinolenta]